MKKIFKPYVLNNKLELKNRFVMAPMTTWSGNADETVSKAELDYYEYRSHGAGMIITATSFLEASGKGFDGQFYSGNDDMLPSMTALASTIKRHGSRAILQVFHAGRKGQAKKLPEGVTLSASDVPGKRESNNIPRPMTDDEIQATIQSFADLIIRADKAGFDGVEIHGANTYLIQQFFSPHSNIRKDQWGGSLENRAKMPLAIVKACLEARDKLDNKSFVVGYRFSPEENSTPGITLEDTLFLVDALAESDLDYLHISLGKYDQTSIRDDSSDILLSKILKCIDNRKALIGVGSVYSLLEAIDVLSYGCDLVALGRQLLIDGQTIEKWAKGQEAKDLYDTSHYEEEHIPKPLHDKIVKIKNWVPKK
jgi:2,4-dienoyl-CoA reductase-like NADH-dependent reductase (Old Yellow Enzyme family)